MANFYQVGGSVRDMLLGIKSKDIDYAVEAASFDAMRTAILSRGGKIFLETPQFFTIRAWLPDLGACDYVLCRKDGAYSDGRHPDDVSVGTLMDDLARRDFTVNAMALTEDGQLLDPFNGASDLRNRQLVTVGRAEDRFREDGLRMLRALRFAVTKGFYLSKDIRACLTDFTFVETYLTGISEERIREELTKMFAFDTYDSMVKLERFPYVKNRVFAISGRLWLKPTLESRG